MAMSHVTIFFKLSCQFLDSLMSPVEFKKRPCRPVEFKGQGPLLYDQHSTTESWRKQNTKTDIGRRFIVSLTKNMFYNIYLEIIYCIINEEHLV